MARLTAPGNSDPAFFERSVTLRNYAIIAIAS
jgi:hypothetical protein